MLRASCGPLRDANSVVSRSTCCFLSKVPNNVTRWRGDTWFHGIELGERATAWTTLWTGGKGTYCTTQQEDNATYMALSRGAISGLVDLNRVAVLRTASNFDRPYPGQSAWHSLCSCGPGGSSGGFEPSIRNLWAAAAPFIKDVVAHWDDWQRGVPK